MTRNSGFFIGVHMTIQVPQGAEDVRVRSMGVELGEREEGQTEFEISFSSEQPCLIWGDTEILSHEPSAMRVGERQQTLALLFNHNRDDLIGAVSNVHIDQTTRKGRCTIRFAETDRGQEMRKLFETGMLSNVSVSYRVFKYAYDKDTEVFTALDWEPLEISLVTVPADPTVGKGRSLNEPENLGQKQGENVMPEMNPGNEDQIRAQAQQQERERVQAVSDLCRAHNIDEAQMREFINQGTTVENARAAVLDIIKSRQTNVPTVTAEPFNERNIDMSRYSLSRAILASVTNNWEGAEYERQVSEHLARSLNRTPDGILVPFNVIARDLSTASGSGAALVPTDHRDDLFVEPLRKKTIVGQLGAVFLSGLHGDISIPVQSTSSNMYWVTEGTAHESKDELKFEDIKMTPHTVIGITRVTRKLLLQSSPAIDELIRQDFLKSMAIAIDEAALNGTGSGGQPKGILHHEKVTVLNGDTNGVVLTYDHIVDLETKVAEADATGENMAYAANATTVGQLKKLKNQNGDLAWYTAPGAVSGTPGQINGYNVARSNIIPSDLTKGSATKGCSALIFGDFSQLLIGQWGAVEITANPFETNAYRSGSIELRIINMVDIGIRQPKAFAVMKDVLNKGAAA